MAIAMVKVTFTLDEDTVRRLGIIATRLSKPKSQVVREAIDDYHAKSGRMSESEKIAKLRALDELLARPSTKTQKDVDREIAEIRAVRRLRGRLHPVD